jgi:hypothetical protein
VSARLPITPQFPTPASFCSCSCSCSWWCVNAAPIVVRLVGWVGRA